MGGIENKGRKYCKYLLSQGRKLVEWGTNKNILNIFVKRFMLLCTATINPL